MTRALGVPQVPVNENNERQCVDCGTNFPWKPRVPRCPNCQRQLDREKQNRMDPLIRRDKRLRRAYGISLKEFGERIVAQNHECPICQSIFKAIYSEREDGSGRMITHTVDDPKRGHAVPDHVVLADGSKYIRGILCQTCNRGLGHFGDGDVEMLERALHYLRPHPSHNS